MKNCEDGVCGRCRKEGKNMKTKLSFDKAINEIFSEIEGVFMGGDKESIEFFNEIDCQKMDVHTVQELYKDWKIRRKNLEAKFKNHE